MKRSFIFTLFSLLLAFSATGQIKNPVRWSTSWTKISDKEAELVFTATIDPGWYVYSQFLDDGGPIPTSFSFKAGPHFQLLGKAKEEGKRKEGFDEIFGMNVVKFSGTVNFKQRVKVVDPKVPVTGYLEYMTCDNEQCLPPTEEDFSFDLGSMGGERAGVDKAPVETNKAPAEGATGLEAPIILQEEPVPAENPVPEGTDASALDLLYGSMPKPALDKPADDCGSGEVQIGAATGLGKIFFLGFLGGLLALLTPCVFPMIPLTVSFFTKSSGQGYKKGLSQAGLYGFFILAVYLLLSIPFHLMDSINPDILNDISTNVWLNIAFFAIFLVFAFSFFGYYELTLPSSWVNRTSNAEGVGGALGVFFMALTLALVSFSCTGPILGSLLAGALTSNGGAWQLTAGMGGFGFALALPFTLFAAFPGMMKNLPKSGGWLNTVKVVLGFLELALALKFLSNADLVKHWGILAIEPFLALWMLIFLGLALYLFGVIRFPHDSPGKRPRVQIMLGIASLAFTGYLGTGFAHDEQAGSYQSLKLLSGLAPPVCYSWFQPCNCPQNLSCFKDLQEGLAYARQVKKPVMLDFTGHACVNCRKMEEHVWPRPAVYSQLKNDYVVISLYVDDKRELPAEEQIEVPKITGGTRKLRTVGQKWSHFQTEYFKTNSQPFYVLMSPEGQLLNAPIGYTPDAKDYSAFLQCGKDTFLRLASK